MERHSKVTEYENISAFSQAPAECIHHLIPGRGLRQLADEDGLYIPLTNAEHNMSPNGKLYQVHENPVAMKLSKMLGQAVWMMNRLAEELGNETFDADEWKDQVKHEFMSRYGENFL